MIIHETIIAVGIAREKYQAGKVAESEANGSGLGVLQLLGAPKSEITYMQSQDGGHADRNGGGVSAGRTTSRGTTDPVFQAISARLLLRAQL